MTRETGGEKLVLLGEQVLSEQLCLQRLFEGRVWRHRTIGGMGSNKIVQVGVADQAATLQVSVSDLNPM